MSDSEIIMSLSGTSNKRKRDERLLVDQANNCLPLEIVEEILAMLPTKSINRFMSVSKSWFSMLVSADFQKFRCKSTPPPPETIPGFIPKLLLTYYDSSSSSDVFKLSSYCNTETPTRESYPIQNFWVRNSRHGPFLGSCNGLVCLEHSYEANYRRKWEIVVWNPFTGIFRKLPEHDHMSSSSSALISYAYGFGYDSGSDDYKVFLARRTRVHIFSLKAGSWKEVEVKNPDRNKYLKLLRGRSMGLFLNGALHWESKNCKEDCSARIVAFDLAKEKFYDVFLPQSSHHQLSPLLYGYKYYSMGVVGEYLCVIFSATDQYQPPANIVWVMKEYCNKASWAHFVSYSWNRIHEGTYVSDSIPISAKDGGYIGLQYSVGYIDVLHLINNNPDEESDEAVEHSKKKVIKFFFKLSCGAAIPYTEALTSPYASTGIDQRIFEHPLQKKKKGLFM
ncbi:hypothetical protein Tsubulata_039814 [Turnera subulata]|uniref:F-box domain-containing protein n=1 Tax=Turnera subulata TaxID=218843 RepID=A0A9Q0J1E4_9ROSI|nr:hypothetical protein Tsubulata_039814 [Turnera subulata]